MISKKFVEAIRKSNIRQYTLANAVGLHFTTLSHILIGAMIPKSEDERLLKIADLIGFPRSEIFINESNQSND